MPELRFNKNLYKKCVIDTSITAYQGLAEFKVMEEKSYLKVKIEGITPGLKDILPDEFSNYVLTLTKRCL